MTDALSLPARQSDRCSKPSPCAKTSPIPSARSAAGEATILIEPQLLREALFVVGAGHCAQAIVRLAVECGLFVQVVEDRTELLDVLPAGALRESAASAPEFIAQPPMATGRGDRDREPQSRAGPRCARQRAANPRRRLYRHDRKHAEGAARFRTASRPGCKRRSAGRGSTPRSGSILERIRRPRSRSACWRKSWRFCEKGVLKVCAHE